MKIELVDSLPVLKEPVLSPNTVLVPSQDQFPPLPSKLTQQGFPSKNNILFFSYYYLQKLVPFARCCTSLHFFGYFWLFLAISD